jgi:hypothetical protein
MKRATTKLPDDSFSRAHESGRFHISKSDATFPGNPLDPEIGGRRAGTSGPGFCLLIQGKLSFDETSAFLLNATTILKRFLVLPLRRPL